jgi:hypothetical protein
MTPSGINIVLCNILSADRIALSIGERCRVMHYSLPLSFDQVPRKTVLVLRPTLKDTLQDDRVSILRESIKECSRRNVFVALCTTPRFGGGPRASKIVNSSNLRCMEIAARSDIGLFDLELVLAHEGAGCFRGGTDELSDAGITTVTEALRRALEEFSGRIPRENEIGG